MEHLGRREGMEILAGQERLLHSLVPGDMSQEPQLHLGVVRIHQYVPRGGHKHAPYAAAHLCAGGDVLQIRLRGGQAACGRHRHLKAGADAAIRVHHLQQAVGIGAFQLGILPVLQHIRHNGGLPAKLFQHVRVGGPPGFGLFPVGQLHFFKQHRPQLLGGVDVEALPGLVVDASLQVRDPVGHVPAKGRQGLSVHQEAPLLHPGQHGAQWQLHGLVKLRHVHLPQPSRQNVIQRSHSGAVAMHSCPSGGGVSQGREGVLFQLCGPWQLLVEIRHKQPLQVVAPNCCVQQIGRQGRVEYIPLRVHSPLQQGAHGVLNVVAHLTDVRSK